MYIKQFKLNKSLSLCESGMGSFRNKHAEQIIWAVICFVSTQQVHHSDVNRWKVFGDSVIFLTLKAEVGLKAVTTCVCSLRATEQVGLTRRASYSESVLSNLGEYQIFWLWFFVVFHQHLQVAAEERPKIRPLTFSSPSLPIQYSLFPFFLVLNSSAYSL